MSKVLVVEDDPVVQAALVHALTDLGHVVQAVGTAVAGGMFVSTFLNIIFIPVLYVVIETVRERVTGAPVVTPRPTPRPAE